MPLTFLFCSFFASIWALTYQSVFPNLSVFASSIWPSGSEDDKPFALPYSCDSGVGSNVNGSIAKSCIDALSYVSIILAI